jgi:hypothetical protein
MKADALVFRADVNSWKSCHRAYVQHVNSLEMPGKSAEEAAAERESLQISYVPWAAIVRERFPTLSVKLGTKDACNTCTEHAAKMHVYSRVEQEFATSPNDPDVARRHREAQQACRKWEQHAAHARGELSFTNCSHTGRTARSHAQGAARGWVRGRRT